MSIDKFRELNPSTLDAPLAALWWMEKDEWERAHSLVQAENSADAAWVHAHLHRVEGDLSNAQYWYRKAGKVNVDGDLIVERQAMILALWAA